MLTSFGHISREASHRRPRSGFVRELGQQVVVVPSLRHTSITIGCRTGTEDWTRAGQDSRAQPAPDNPTLMLYVDEREKDHTQRTLADLVAGTLNPSVAVGRT
jgi:hypothetical protein